MARTAFAPGKMILSGEYAVLFGHRGIAVPSPLGVEVTYEENGSGPLARVWSGIAGSGDWEKYLSGIIQACEKMSDQTYAGKLTIRNSLPLGKGMGSSTAFLIATAKVLLGDDIKKEQIKELEDRFSPGNSGIDFEVIWQNSPLVFRKESEPEPATVDLTFLHDAVLIDTGTPHEITSELVTWVRSREAELKPHLEVIGQCTERLIRGEDPRAIIPDHHRAQVALGVVPAAVQELIAEIEKSGSVAKVIGAGARTGGGGMVLSIAKNRESIVNLAKAKGFSCITFSELSHKTAGH